MSLLSIFRSLGAKIVVVPIAAFLLGLCIPGFMAYKLLLRQADRETHEKALVALQILAAARRYADTTGGSSAGSVHPGSAAVAQIIRRYEAGQHEDTFRYRRVALNATDEHSQADAKESALIRSFVRNPGLGQIELEMDQNHRGTHLLATPVTVSQASCLSCHDSPKTAPAWRLKQYGHVGGFGWKKGQVVGIDVVYLSSDFPRSQMLTVFWTVTQSIALLAFICSVLLVVRAYLLIARPTARLIATSEAIQRGEWRPWTSPRFPDELGDLAGSFHATTVRLRERIAHEEKLRALFQQFIPASVAAQALGKNGSQILVGTRHSVTVMIINIRNFKLLMDHLPPDQTVTTLNEYFAAVNRVIVANKGLVSRYMGDSVMAIFGMPLTRDNHALCAVRAALAIPQSLQNLYVQLDERYGWELGVGIGISTGEPIVGSFGSSEHLEYSVLGDVVGEAALLEGVTKSIPEEDSVLISEPTYRSVMSDVHVFDLGEKKGSSGAVIHAYAVQGFRSEVSSSLAA